MHPLSNTVVNNRAVDAPKPAFWIVWNPNAPYAPRVKHGTKGQALAEAERLARAHPGGEFYVMKADEMRVLGKMVRVSFDQDEIPF